MTKRDFFRLVIKLIAFNTILSAILVLPIQFFNIHLGIDDILQIVGITFLGIFVMATLIYLSIKYTDKIVDFFMLDKGYDSDKIEINTINSQQIIRLIIIFISATLIVNNLPNIFVEAIKIFKYNAYGSNFVEKNSIYLGIYIRITSVLLGIIILFNSTKISHFLDKK